METTPIDNPIFDEKRGIVHNLLVIRYFFFVKK